ncbi:MAG: hypothetical protein KA436_02055 [Oligoflexales bacterium]|nr:hypothetical protein [Oligoflexales bacterium]
MSFATEVQRLRKRWKALSQQGDRTSLTHKVIDKLAVYAQFPFRQRQFEGRCFSFAGKSLPYVIHHYNATWRNERCVELAVALDFLKECKNRKVLELGNVLAYYGDVSHDVVDKYEEAEGIFNIDFVKFNPQKPYDAFLSISTLEHIGWDEPKRDPTKISKALSKIKDLVTHKDQVLVSFPLGYNDHLDQLVQDEGLPFQTSYYYIRISESNEWSQVSKGEALSKKYGSKFEGANSLYFGMGLS